MTKVAVPGRSGDVIIACEYSNQDQNVRLFDLPVISWLIHETTHAQQPVVPGSLPPPAAVPGPTTPTWVMVILTSQQTVVGIVPDQKRCGSLREFLDWITGSGAKLRGEFAAPLLARLWLQWAENNPSKVY